MEDRSRGIIEREEKVGEKRIKGSFDEKHAFSKYVVYYHKISFYPPKLIP